MIPAKMPQERLATPTKVNQLVRGTYFTTVGNVLVDLLGNVYLDPEGLIFSVKDDVNIVEIWSDNHLGLHISLHNVPESYKWHGNNWEDAKKTVPVVKIL